MRKRPVKVATILLCVAMLCMQVSAAESVAAQPECNSMECVTTAEDLAEFYAPNADLLNDEVPSGQVQESMMIAEPTVEVIYEGNDYEDITGGDLLIPEIARGTNKPTAFWNLSSKGKYLAIFESVTSTTLYTNYYFDFAPFTHGSGELEGVEDGRIYVKYTVYT